MVWLSGHKKMLLNRADSLAERSDQLRGHPELRLLAERLRNRVDQEITITRLNDRPTLTISIGVASLGEDTPTLESLLDKADAALYEAKRAGRNTVVAK